MSFMAWVAVATIPLWAVAIILRRRRLARERDVAVMAAHMRRIGGTVEMIDGRPIGRLDTCIIYYAGDLDHLRRNGVL